MVVINSGDPLPDLVIVILARWSWRYRSELAPLAVAVITALTAWLLHATYARWWPELTGATVAAAAGTGLAGGRLGLGTRAERIYAMAVLITAGGWLAAATAVGPWRQPLPQVLLASAGILAVPWWAHRPAASPIPSGSPRQLDQSVHPAPSTHRSAMSVRSEPRPWLPPLLLLPCTAARTGPAAARIRPIDPNHDAAT